MQKSIIKKNVFEERIDHECNVMRSTKKQEVSKFSVNYAVYEAES